MLMKLMTWSKAARLWQDLLIEKNQPIQSIKYVTLFLANLNPPVTLCHTSWDPKKVRHISDPRFLVGLVQEKWTKALCTNSLSIVCGSSCPEAFVRGSFVWK